MRMRRLVAPTFFAAFALSSGPTPALAQPGPTPVGPAPGAPVTSAPVTSAPAPSAPVTSPPEPAAAAATPKSGGVEFTSLRLMLSKGVISQAEYDAALRDLGETSGMRAPDGNSFVLGKWATTLYGFVEGDVIFDSTQSLNEIAGNASIARKGTYAGDHGRTQFAIRNSRVGLRLKAPEVNSIRASAQLEMDFFGGAAPASGAEATVFNNPVLRVRHMNVKVETPIVDFLIGQYWTLQGWHAQYLPATVEIQGVPGGIFSRQVQIQVSKTVKTAAFTFEAALAALRPPQRDSAMPAGQAGLRFAVNRWTAPQTANYTGTSIQPLSLAVTGDARAVRLPEVSAAPRNGISQTGWSIAVDTFIPIVPGGKENRGNSLALNGEFSTGFGAGDMYTGLTGGLTTTGLLPPLPNPTNTTPAPTYDPRIDNGIAVFDATGGLHLVQWTGLLAGIQYYFPGSGNLFASANYSRAQSSNASLYGAATKARKMEQWFDVNLFADVTPAVRFGVEYANFNDTYADGEHATNHRVQASGAFLF